MNLTERMKALGILADTVQDVIRAGWMDRVDLDELSDTWHSGEYTIRWYEDGTAAVCDLGAHTPLLRFRVEVTVSAVEPEPEVNEPRGFVLTREWQEIPAGWFVQSPKDPDVWFEVMRTEREPNATENIQIVTLRAPDGRTVTTRRPAGDEVKVRKGTEGAAVAEALELLGPGAHIIEDQVS